MHTIYVDLDDVISKTTCYYVDVLKREFGKTVAFESITSFDLQNSFALTDREYEEFFRLVHEPEIILELEPVEGSVNVLNKWSEQGYKISIVTGRLTSTHESSLEWLRNNHIPFDSFIMVDKYSRPEVDRDIAITLEQFSELEFILAVEDSADMVNFINRKMKSSVILFDRPWNRNGAALPGITRYRTWEEIGKFKLNSI